jgi:chemotaxis protein methyltransferase CheR
VLNRAKEGKYSQLEVNRGLPAQLLVKYFARTGTEYQVKEELRNWMEFREMNLATEWQAQLPVDILFLRNVLIYFDQDVKKKILSRVKRVLRPDGWMFLGGAETTMNLDEGFERLPMGKSVCYKVKR